MKVNSAIIVFRTDGSDDDIFVRAESMQIVIARHNLKAGSDGNYSISPALIDEARAIDDAARARGEKVPTQKEMQDSMRGPGWKQLEWDDVKDKK
jgi:hypothetical protein